MFYLNFLTKGNNFPDFLFAVWMTNQSKIRPIWSIVIKFHMELPGVRGTKVSSNDSGHMTNMAAM